MYSKVVIISALVAISHAGIIVEDNHHAVSSQSIVHHSQPTHQINAHLAAPIYTRATPILHHAPVIQQGPFVHQAPLVHTTPVVHAAPVVQHVSPVVHTVAQTQAAEEHAPAHYEFSYSVEDPHTGDHKSQHESREGDLVKGEYSLLQPDGSIRKVEYTADDHSGFNAIVHQSAPSAHAAPAPAHAVPVAHITPVVHAVPIHAHH